MSDKPVPGCSAPGLRSPCAMAEGDNGGTTQPTDDDRDTAMKAVVGALTLKSPAI
jgi:hypothetical protein